MGNTNPSSQPTSQLINKCWQPISPQLWKNKITSEIIKEKRLIFQSQQEMKYAFSCLVRRMNDYHPNVMKVFYLRKLYQKGSLCNCGEKHTIQVYVQNVDCTLEKYIIKNANCRIQGVNKINNYKRKCVCMQIVKAAVYLKERYGSFIVSNKNVWIQQQRVQHKTEDRKVQLSTQQKEQPLQTIKAKLWISAQEQNFPDRSCQEREMCFSLVGLIRNCLVDTGLCKCFSNMEVLERLMHVGSVKELEQVMRKEREQGEKNQLKGSHVVKEEPKVAFTRTIRSYSSQDSSTQNQHYFAPNLPFTKFRPYDATQQPSQRKYSLIEQTKKPTLSRKVQFITPTINQNPHFVKQVKTNDNSKNVRNKIDNYFVQESGLTVKPDEKTRMTKMYSDHNNEKQNNLNVQHLRNTQPINPRTHYNRHLNNLITNKLIISLADMTGDDISAVSIQTIKADGVEVERVKQSEKKDQQVKDSMDDKNDKKNTEKLRFLQNKNQVEEVQKIELKLDVNKAQVAERSQEKVIDQTDRTRFDYSLKGDEKKQHQEGSSSRRNISTIPISMNSSSLAGQFPKLTLHSYDHQRKILVENRDFGQEIIEKKEQQNQKKESAASSKSEKNYVSYNGGSDQSIEKEGQKTTTLKKRMSSSNILPRKESNSEENISKESNEFHDIHIKQPINSKQNQKVHPFQHTNKLDTIGQFFGNQRMGRLRHSEYITSAQHLLMTQNRSTSQQEVNQSHMLINYIPQQQHTQTQTQLSSLGLLQHKFKTNVSIEDNYEVRNQLRKKLRVDDAQGLSIRECVSGEMHQRYYNNQLMREQQQQELDDGIKQQGLQQRNVTMSLNTLQKLKQSSSKSSKHNDYQQQFHSSIKQSSLHSIRIQKQNFTKGKTPYITQARNNNNEMKQLIKRQSEYPASPYEKFRLWQQNQKQMSYEGQKSLQYNVNINREYYVDSQQYSSQQQQYQYQQQKHHQQQLSQQLLSQHTLPEFSNFVKGKKKLSLKQQFSQLFNFDNQQQQSQYDHEKQKKQKMKKMHHRQTSVAISMYNSSEYKQSKNMSKRINQKINNNYQLRLARPPNNKTLNTPISKYTKDKFTKKPISKQQVQMIKKNKQQQSNNNNNDYVLQTPPKNILRMTSSGHEDNSIRQKVISKKAQFAQLKNQMNILLL